MSSFTDVRSKFMSIKSMSNLVSIIKVEGKNLEEFAMIVWLIWIRRNKLRINEAAFPSTKLVQSASALLVEFQQGKQWQDPKKNAGPVRWQPPLEDTVKVNFDGVVCSGRTGKQAMGWSYTTMKGRC